MIHTCTCKLTCIRETNRTPVATENQKYFFSSRRHLTLLGVMEKCKLSDKFTYIYVLLAHYFAGQPVRYGRFKQNQSLIDMFSSSPLLTCIPCYPLEYSCFKEYTCTFFLEPQHHAMRTMIMLFIFTNGHLIVMPHVV